MENHKLKDGAFLTAASPGVVALFQVIINIINMYRNNKNKSEQAEIHRCATQVPI